MGARFLASAAVRVFGLEARKDKASDALRFAVFRDMLLMILTDEDRRGNTEGEKTEDESIPRPLAEAYTGHFLAPALKRGLVVVMDNPSAHKGERVRRPIENGGWE